MLSALAPGYLRVGGTMADRLYFIRDSQPSFKIHFVSEIDGGVCSQESVTCNYLLRPNFTMSGNYEYYVCILIRLLRIYMSYVWKFYVLVFLTCLST